MTDNLRSSNNRPPYLGKDFKSISLSHQHTLTSNNIHSYFQLAKVIVSKVSEIEARKKKVVLVADDEPLTFRLIEEFFQDANLLCDTLEAPTGRVAYDMAVENLPDLIITDWLMPELDGLSLIKQLKANPRTKDIPVIMTTGALLSNGEFRKVLLTGAIDCIRKPFENLEFMSRVKTALAFGEALKEIKENEESIHSKDLFLHFLVDVTPNPIFIMDKMGSIIGCNEGFEKLLRETKPEIINSTVQEVLPRFLSNFCDEVDTVKTGVINRFEIEYLDSVNGYRNLLLNCIGLGDAAEMVIGSITDITEIIQSNNEKLTRLESTHKKEKEQIEGSLEQLQSKLDFKHREVAMHLELLIHSRSVKERLIAGINKLHAYLTLEGKSKLSTLLKQLKWEVDEEIDLGIEKKFDEANAVFYSVLEKGCPGITRNEKRLCAYLKMNHGPSDIAKITRKSLNSINVALARLRAKFQLPKTKHLRSYLNEFDHGWRETV